MFELLQEIHARPAPFDTYTAQSLWADEYRSQQMLAFHLNEGLDVSSRNTGFIDRSAAWIIDRFGLGPDTSVCDFGCGPGLYTSRFAASGAKVAGLDFSPRSIEHAQTQARLAGQQIDYIHGNYLDFDRETRFDLITLIMCDFCALGPSQRADLLAIFRKHLERGGAVLLDVYSMAGFETRHEASVVEKNQLDHFWCESDYYCFVNTFKYDDDAVVLDKYTVFPEQGKPETVYNWLQYFSPRSLTEEVSAAGFRVETLYRDVAGDAFTDQHTEFAAVLTL